MGSQPKESELGFVFPVWKPQPWQEGFLKAVEDPRIVRVTAQFGKSNRMMELAEKYLNWAFARKHDELVAGAGPGFREMVSEELLK